MAVITGDPDEAGCSWSQDQGGLTAPTGGGPRVAQGLLASEQADGCS